MHGGRQLLRSGASKKEAFAWASLDFANSGYTTVVLTAVFNAYFVSTVMGGVALATLAWTLVLSVSYLLVMITAPVLGAYADLRARKKLLLIMATLGCGLATALLASVGPGMWAWAALLLVVSNFCYATHQDLSAAFLPEIATPQAYGRVSGYGWAWGYLGGLVALAGSLAWVGIAQSHAMSAQEVVGGTMLITAALFVTVALPALAVLRERAVPAQHTQDWQLKHWLAASWGRLHQTWQLSGSQPDLRRFLWCVAVYHAGVQTVIALAAVYAQQVMGFSMAQTLVLILLVNITAAIGAWGFGLLQDQLGHARGLMLALLFWIGMIILAWMADTEPLFWAAANCAGLAMGASQSGARAAVAHLARPGHQAETFGLWGVAVNFSAILGPVSYGVVTWITGNAHRTAMLATGLFFIVGLVLLMRVDFDRGHRAAQSPAS
ncbi:MAG: MFS transporter [Burkholderiaceae bacterium]|nr:MFS transporter [Burkholderiaceae bacterium]